MFDQYFVEDHKPKDIRYCIKTCTPPIGSREFQDLNLFYQSINYISNSFYTMESINLHEIYFINPAYKFRGDITSSVLTNDDSILFNMYDSDDNVTSSFCWKTHPLITFLFSFFDGSENLTNTINAISKETGFSVDELTKALTPFIENKEIMVFPLLRDNIAFSIPKNFLIKKHEKHSRGALLNGMNINEIMQNLDLTSTRLKIPNEITFMVGNACVTNCIYCYADKTHKIEKYLSFERIKKLIKEARILQVRNCEVAGGEFFLYENWYELLKLLRENNYNPLLSTKVPIDESMIIKLKELGVEQIQISLDSIDNTTLKKMISVDKYYFGKMDNTIRNLEKHNIYIIDFVRKQKM